MTLLPQSLKSLAIVVGAYGILSICSPVALAEDERGQVLYENHCMFCHETWVHKRDGRHITTQADLRQRVAAWSAHSGLEWTDEEIDDVTGYLSRHFYQIKN